MDNTTKEFNTDDLLPVVDSVSDVNEEALSQLTSNKEEGEQNE